MKEAVCAVVVSYHPDAEVVKNLEALRAQVASVVVVDNGSTVEEIAMLCAASARLGFTLLRNRANFGIATALNRGVMWAREQDFEWVLLFDQDSTVTDGFVATMLECFQMSADAQSIAILVPRYVDRRFGSVLEPPPRNAGGLEAATTSGSLMPTEVFAIAGMFADELFIDGVDYEYSLRVRRVGMRIEECAEAVLLHSPGTPTMHRLPGCKPFQSANYSPVRRYYQERNKIWVTKRYWREFSGFCLRQFAISAKDLLKIVLVEEQKARKVQHFARGVLDGVRGRTGKL